MGTSEQRPITPSAEAVPVLVAPYLEYPSDLGPNSEQELAIREVTVGATEQDTAAIANQAGVASGFIRLGAAGVPRVDMRLPFIDANHASELVDRIGLSPDAGQALFKTFERIISPEDSSRDRAPDVPMALYQSPDSGLPSCNLATLHQMADVYASRPQSDGRSLSFSNQDMIIALTKWNPLPRTRAEGKTRFAGYGMSANVWVPHVSENDFWQLSEAMGFSRKSSPHLYGQISHKVCKDVSGSTAGYADYYVRQAKLFGNRGIPLSLFLKTINFLPTLSQMRMSGARGMRLNFAEKHHLVKYAATMQPYLPGA